MSFKKFLFSHIDCTLELLQGPFVHEGADYELGYLSHYLHLYNITATLVRLDLACDINVKGHKG